MPQTPRFVFVYGTLRQGQSNDINRLQPAPRFVCVSRIEGELYDLGPYPGVLLRGLGAVVGEVYEIEPELERRLDEIEEVYPQATGEYSRRQVRVPTPDGDLPCLVYEIHPSRLKGAVRLPAGDWSRRP